MMVYLPLVISCLASYIKIKHHRYILVISPLHFHDIPNDITIDGDTHQGPTQRRAFFVEAHPEDPERLPGSESGRPKRRAEFRT